MLLHLHDYYLLANLAGQSTNPFPTWQPLKLVAGDFTAYHGIDDLWGEDLLYGEHGKPAPRQPDMLARQVGMNSLVVLGRFLFLHNRYVDFYTGEPSPCPMCQGDRYGELEFP
jgi:hypothetical protein